MPLRSFRRSAVALTAAGALALGGGVAASTTFASAETGQRSTPAAVIAPGYAQIKGQVTDAETGKPIDDVFTMATRFSLKKRELIRASDLSYANPDNTIAHGYYVLHLPHGKYDVSYYKKDYELLMSKVRRTQGQKNPFVDVELVPLPESKLQVKGAKKNKVLTVTLPKNKKKAKKKNVVVKVALKSKAEGKAPGKLVLKDGGRTVGSEKLRNDKVTFKLGKAVTFDSGTYTLVYGGSDEFRSAEQDLTIRIK